MLKSISVDEAKRLHAKAMANTFAYFDDVLESIAKDLESAKFQAYKHENPTEFLKSRISEVTKGIEKIREGQSFSTSLTS